MAIKIYTTRREAEEVLKKLKPYEPFCPLIDRRCSPQCVCFVPAVVATSATSLTATYRVTRAYCSNAMFLETEVVINV